MNGQSQRPMSINNEGDRVSGNPKPVKDVPVGVKIISVLYYIGAAFAVIFGVLFLFGAGFISSYFGQFLGALGTGMFIFGGLVFVGLGILNFFIGRGLWKARNWARIVAIIFAILGFISAIIILVSGEFFSSIINLIFQGAIGGYFLFSKKVKATFT